MLLGKLEQSCDARRRARAFHDAKRARVHRELDGGAARLGDGWHSGQLAAADEFLGRAGGGFVSPPPVGNKGGALYMQGLMGRTRCSNH